MPGRPAFLWLAGFAVVIGGAAPKPLQFWNLTSTTITELHVASPGKNNWSTNLCLSDPDHTVEADERIGLVGVAGGNYDVRVVDQKGRTCLFRHLAIKPDGPYALSVSEDQMKACTEH